MTALGERRCGESESHVGSKTPSKKLGERKTYWIVKGRAVCLTGDGYSTIRALGLVIPVESSAIKMSLATLGLEPRDSHFDDEGRRGTLCAN